MHSVISQAWPDVLHESSVTIGWSHCFTCRAPVAHANKCITGQHRWQGRSLSDARRALTGRAADDAGSGLVIPTLLPRLQRLPAFGWRLDHGGGDKLFQI